VNEFFNEKNVEEVILATLFVIYLIMGYPLPSNVNFFLNTLFGKILVISVCILLFVIANPIVSVLGFLVAFDLLAKSMNNHSVSGNKEQLYETNRQIVEMQNQSLEADVVQKMAPIPFSVVPITDTVYPSLGSLHDASSI